MTSRLDTEFRVRSQMTEPVCADESLANNIFYQALREKERLVREYKFKYETSKALYEELLNVLIAQQEKTNTEQVTRHHFTQVYQVVDDELLKLQVKRPDINRIKLVLMDKIDRIIAPIFTKSCSSGNWSSPKAMRLDSQHDTHTGRISSSNNSVHSEPFTGKTNTNRPKGLYKMPPALLQSPVGISKLSSQSSTLKEYMLQDGSGLISHSKQLDSEVIKLRSTSKDSESRQSKKAISKSYFDKPDPYGLLFK